MDTTPNFRLASGRVRKLGHARAGFTLIEVMIVILIVLALGGLVAFNLLGTKEKAERDIGRIDLNTIRDAMKMYRFDHGSFPTDEEGIRVLWDKSALTDETKGKNWRKLLDEPMPADRWGTTWGYRQKSEHSDEDTYDVWSFGPDKQEGTEDDITSWADAAAGGGAGDAASGGGSGSGASTGP